MLFSSSHACFNYYHNVGNFVVNLNQIYDPVWNPVEACINLAGSGLTDLDRIAIQDFDGPANGNSPYGDPTLVDDFSLQKLADAGPDQQICLPNTVTLGTCAIDGATYQWQPATGLSCTTCAKPICSVTATTTYTLTVTSPPPTSCTASDQVTVNVCSLPVPTITGDQYSCNPQSQYTITNSSSYSLGTTFTWSMIGDGTISSGGLVSWNNTQGGGTVCVTANPPAGCGCPPQQGCYTVLACCEGKPGTYGCNIMVVQNLTSTQLEAALNAGNGNACDGNPWDSSPSLYTISGGNLTGHEMVINGTLTIDHDLTLLNIPNLDFGPNAQIYNPGYNLTIVNCTLKAGCDLIWKGIICHTVNKATTVINSNFYDAQYAFYFYDRHIFTISNSTFDKDLYDISVWDFSGNPVPYPGSISGCNFKCSANLDNPYSTERTWIGIFAQNVSGANNGGLTIGVNNMPNNTFDGIQMGVEVLNTTVTITKENIFQNIVNNIPTDPIYNIQHGKAVYAAGSSSNFLTLTGWGNAPNSTINFSNCTYGVYMINMNCTIQSSFMNGVNYGVSAFYCNNNKLDILNNRINNDITGANLSISEAIQISNCIGASLSIIGNYLKVCENSPPNAGNVGVNYLDNNTLNYHLAIQSNSISVHKAGVGIHTVNMSGGTITNNSIYMYSNNNQTITGIRTENCGVSGGIVVSCNLINPDYLGFIPPTITNKVGLDFDYTINSSIQCNNAQNTDRDILFHHTSNNNDFRTNTMGSANYGFYIFQNANLGLQTDKGNKWAAASYGVLGAFGSTGIVLFRTSTDPTHTPTYGGTVGFQPSGTQPECQLSCSQINPAQRLADDGNSDTISTDEANIITSLDTLIAIGDTSIYTNVDSNAIWMQQTYLYQKVHDDSALIDTNNVMSNFYDGNQNTVLGELISISDSVVQLNGNPYSTEIDSFESAINSLLLNYNSNQLELSDSLTAELLKDSLIQQNGFLSGEMTILQKQVDSLNILSDSLAKIRVLSIVQANSLITDASEQHDLNQQSVNDIYLKTFAEGVDTFTIDQIQELTLIALQCPNIGGPAVFTARYMLSYADHSSSFNDSNICGEDARVASHTTIIQQRCLIFPNPAKGFIYVTYELPNNENGDLVLINSLGTKIMTIHLSSQYRATTIDISSFDAGIYLYQMISLSGLTIQGKFVKIQ